MRKFVLAGLFLVTGSAAALAPATFGDEAAKPAAAADQPRTMEDVVNRVISNENHMYGKVKEFSPLVETYIQNLKPDKELGEVPRGDKYFLGKADFSKGVNLVSLTEANTKGKKILGGIGGFLNFGLQYLKLRNPPMPPRIFFPLVLA